VATHERGTDVVLSTDLEGQGWPRYLYKCGQDREKTRREAQPWMLVPRGTKGPGYPRYGQ
jgi:hypothetical protein